MNQNEINTILDCLPKGRTKFYYFKDYYAAMLLSYCINGSIPVSGIKKSSFAALLERAPIKHLLQQTGDGQLRAAALESLWDNLHECYLLTLGVWGKRGRWVDPYYQTTRCGYNLVLQLNFSQKHNRPFHELVRPVRGYPFESFGHPVAEGKHHTLAWSRMDINMDAGEVLIEEIQNDWIRNALWVSKRIERFLQRRSPSDWPGSGWARHMQGRPEDILKYVYRVLAAHIRLWDEAMMAAAIWFLRRELGIRTIYYHTFDSGNKLKHFRKDWPKPPRSIYTTLPRKFCFKKTDQLPDWIATDNRKRSRSLKHCGKIPLWQLCL